MKKSFLILLTVAMLVGLVGVSAMAMGGPKGQGAFMGMKALNLTADQQKKILEIRQTFEKDTLTIRQSLQVKMNELRELWAAQSPDVNKINVKTQEITPLRVQLMTKSRDMQEQIKKVLTPEQLKKFETMRPGRGNGMRGKGLKFQGKGFKNCPGLGFDGKEAQNAQ